MLLINTWYDSYLQRDCFRGFFQSRKVLWVRNAQVTRDDATLSETWYNVAVICLVYTKAGWESWQRCKPSRPCSRPQPYSRNNTCIEYFAKTTFFFSTLLPIYSSIYFIYMYIITLLTVKWIVAINIFQNICIAIK